MPSPPHDGDADKACSGSSRRVPVAPGAGAFRGLLRKPLSARQAGVSVAMFAGANIGGGGDRARTDDPLLAKQVLSQLSYTPSRDQASVIRHQNRSSDY
jgi:hypothetical protein